jgi:uncharacterized protein (DUF488 family)
MHRIFREHMTSDRALVELAQATSLATERRVCMLCFERDPACCHRSIVAEMVAADTGQAVTHLFPAAP